MEQTNDFIASPRINVLMAALNTVLLENKHPQAVIFSCTMRNGRPLYVIQGPHSEPVVSIEFIEDSYNGEMFTNFYSEKKGYEYDGVDGTPHVDLIDGMNWCYLSTSGIDLPEYQEKYMVLLAHYIVDFLFNEKLPDEEEYHNDEFVSRMVRTSMVA